MKNRIRILATSDLHGYVYPYDYNNQEEQAMGMAKIATMIKMLKDENTIVIDNGDALCGSPLSIYDHMVNKDQVSLITKVMNEMEYDYVNLGNHDFNFGEVACMNHLEHLNATCITSNVNYQGKPIAPTYIIQEVAGKKVAIFGLTTTATAHFENRKEIAHTRFKHVVDKAKKTVELIHSFEKPDYIICVYHGGFERDFQTGFVKEELNGENVGYQILKEVPYIDVLIAGHQHEKQCGQLFSKTYVETTSLGRSIACVDIYTDTKEIDAQVLDTDVFANDDVLRIAQPIENACQEWLDQPLCMSDMDLKITDAFDARLHKSQLVTLINQIQKEATGADLSSCSLVYKAKGFKKEITNREVMSLFSSPTTLVKKKISGKQLREYLEKTAEFFSIASEHVCVSPWFIKEHPSYHLYDMIDGVDYTIRVSNPIGSRIEELTYQGKPVEDEDEFTIAMNNIRANGGGMYYFLRSLKTLDEYETPIYQLVSDYLSKKEVLRFEPVSNIRVTR